jgi:hypothetical protein
MPRSRFHLKSRNNPNVFSAAKKLLCGIMPYEQRQRIVPDSHLRLLASENLNADV